MFSMNIQGGRPIYEQLCERITELILAGAFQPEEKLPAVRDVAKEMGVNPNTVQRAYRDLEQSGLIYSVPAKGSYVTDLSANAETLAALRHRSLGEFRKSVLDALKYGVTRENLYDEIQKIIQGGENNG